MIVVYLNTNFMELSLSYCGDLWIVEITNDSVIACGQ
jgi:hypothetical protein